MTNKLVYIVLLNYNALEHLKYCLPTIRKTTYSNYKIVLVDNNSVDESIPFISNNYPEIELLLSKVNLGYAGGMNLGAKYALERGAEYIVLANMDIKVHPDWISASVQAFDSDIRVGFVGCSVIGAVKPEPIEIYNDAVLKWKEIKFSETDDFIDGMALFIRNSVFKKIGFLDEAFFAYCEESDFEIRGKKAGFKRVVTNVPLWHYSSGAFNKLPLKSAYLFIRNIIRLSIKHDTLSKTIKVILQLFITGCNPWFKNELELTTTKRLRPKGIVFNFFLINYCIIWNIIHLPNTLMQKKRDYKMILQK